MIEIDKKITVNEESSMKVHIVFSPSFFLKNYLELVLYKICMYILR